MANTTLGNVIARRFQLGKPTQVGDHEIVEGPDGMGHLVIITNIEYEETRAKYDLMSYCGTIAQGNVANCAIAETVTCMKCMHWKIQ